MPVQFVCPQCNQLLSVGRRKIGTEVACPRCQRPIVVPTQEAAAVGVAMKQSMISPPPEEPLAEFLVFDDIPPPIETQPPPVVTSISTSEALPRTTAGRRRPSSSPVWQWAPRSEFPTTMLLLTRRGVYVQGAILAAVALTAFLLGLAIGYGVSPTATSDAAQAEPAIVQGLVQFTDARGQTRPDQGAVIVAVPDESIPDPKLLAAGLRAAAEGGVVPAGMTEGLQRVGGAYTLAGGDGRYSLTLPRAGRYVVLIVSRSAERAATAGIEEFELAVLKRYFDRPEQLIGRNQFNWKVEQIAAAGADRSHTFTAAGEG